MQYLWLADQHLHIGHQLVANVGSVLLRDAFKKKTVKFGTLAQKVGGGQASIPNFCHILIGTNNVGGRGLKGSCHKIIQ